MKSKLRRYISMTLCVIFLFTLMPAAYATDDETVVPEDELVVTGEGLLAEEDLAEAPAAKNPENPADYVNAENPNYDLISKFTFKKNPDNGDIPGLDYYLYSPVKGDDTAKYPVMIWFHGYGQGADYWRPMVDSEVARFASPDYQDMFGDVGGAFILVPRAPENTRRGTWNESMVPEIIQMIDALVADGNVDEDRIYVGGFSMGGGMTWDTIVAHPEKFAAAFPICPYKVPSEAQLKTLLDLPIWLIHGVQDPTCAYSNSTKAANILRAQGSVDVRLSGLDPILNPDGTPEGPGKKVVMQHFAWVPVTYNMMFDDGTPYDPSYPDGFIDWLASKDRTTNTSTQVLPYTIESEVFDWGEGVSKIHINMMEEIPAGSIDTDTFKVTAKGYTYSEYVDDGKGGYTVVSKTDDFIRDVIAVQVSGRIVTLTLRNSYGFLGAANGHGISYTDYLVRQQKPIKVSDSETIRVGAKTYTGIGKFNTMVDAFTSGRYECDYTYEGKNPWTGAPESTKVTGLNYRLYEPQVGTESAALIVWMHGGGEGGSDNRIQITANNVVEWAESQSQAMFKGGAYVLALQAPTYWGPAYNKAVLGAIKEIIATKKIDRDRVYIGGCSMGGLGTWLAIIEEPDLFAAAFPICPAYNPKSEELEAVKDLPIWIINATEDGTMTMAANAYNGLKAIGSKDLYISQFSEVKLDGNEYIAHFVWVYAHNDFSERTDGTYLYDADDVISYDKTKYPDGWICEDSFSPEDAGYTSFKAWLADQVRPAQLVKDNGFGMRLEAEEAKLGGTAKVETGADPGFPNGTTVGFLSDPTSSVTFRFAVDKAGKYDITLRLAPTTTSVMEDAVILKANGVSVPNDIDLPAAPGSGMSVTNYYAFKDYTIPGVELKAGENLLQFKFNRKSWGTFHYGAPNMDYIVLRGPGAKKFDVTLTCFDWGQNVTTIDIDMGAVVSKDDLSTDTFDVTAMELSYFDWGQYKTITANFPRTVEKVDVNGSIVTLTLKTNFEEGTAAGNGFEYYKVEQTKDIGSIAAGSATYYQDEVHEPLVDQFLERTYKAGTSDQLNYRLFVPNTDKYEDKGDGYPLVLWLHGAGESGTDNHAQITANRVTAWIEDDAQGIFGGAFIMAPQNHAPAKTLGALEEVLAEYNGTGGKPKIDRNRLYIGGCSMGGAGTWNTIIAAPDLFAAAFPICPASTPSVAQLETLYYMPIWLIHSITDNTCRVSTSITAYDRLKKMGADNVHMTLFNDVAFETLPADFRAALGHWSWVYVHNNFPYDYANQFTLHNKDGKGVDFTAYGDIKYTGVNSELPSDVDPEYTTFMHWLAAQSLEDRSEEVNFNLESVTYDWGEGLTKVHIYMRDNIDATSVDKDTFTVTAKNYNYTEYQQNEDGSFTPKQVTKDFVRPITKVDVTGKKITLTLECKFDLLVEDGDGMKFESYLVEQVKAITTKDDATIAAGTLAFKESGNRFNVLLDSFAVGRFESDEHAATYRPRGTEEDQIINYIDYRLYSPETQDKVPLVVWLHGGGERGTDNRIQLAANRVTAWIEPEAQNIFGGKAYVLAPQTSIGWGANYAPMVIALIEDIVANNNIDPERIYIGGCSMGGMGTWTMIQQAPELFAAAFPICGGTSASDAVMKTLVDLPIWIIHSVDDNTVNVSASVNAYNKLVELGSKNVFMTLFKQVEIDNVAQPILGHWSWVYVHNNFPYASMRDQILHNAADGTGVSFTDAKGVEYTGVNSELPEDYGYDTFMHWLAAQQTPADTVSGYKIKLEAENANLKGAAIAETAVRATAEANKITFRFNLTSANTFDATFRLAPTGAVAVSDVAKVFVNGTEQNVSFDMDSESVGVYKDYVIKDISLLKGENTIEVVLAGQIVRRVFTGYATLDYVLLEREAPYVPTTPTTPTTPKEEEPEAPKFQDIVNHWAEDDINRVVAAGLFNGTSETTFSPQRTMTRAMFVTVLGRLAEINPDELDEPNNFDDVPAGTWYTNYVTWASLKGIVNGKTSTTFDPDGAVTREELAVMIHRFLLEYGYTLDILEVIQFADSDLVSSWASDAVSYVQNTGIFTGRPGNLFAPKDTATRAEVATVMARLLDLLSID